MVSIVQRYCGSNPIWKTEEKSVEIWHNELGKTFRNWETIKCGIPQGPILCSLLFLLYMNDLPLGINKTVIICRWCQCINL